MASKAGILNVIIGAKISDFLTKMQMVERKTSKTKRSTGVDIEGMQRAFVGAFAVIAAAAVRMSATFSSEMAKIETLVGIAGNKVNAMKKDVVDMAGEVGKSPQELAEALFFVTSAGLRGSEAMDALRASAQASAIGMGETKIVADALTSIMNAYGSEVYGAEEATNLLIRTVKLGKLETDQLAGSIGQLLPIATTLGISFEELGANIATMTRIGLGVEETATTLKGLMNTFIHDTPQASEALAGVNLTMEGLRDTLREKGLLYTLQLLLDAFDGNIEKIGEVVPNIRALTNLLGTAGAQADTYAENLAGMSENFDNLGEGMKRVEQEAMQQYNKSSAELNAIMVQLGNEALPSVVNGLKALNVALGFIRENMDVLAAILGGVLNVLIGPFRWSLEVLKDLIPELTDEIDDWVEGTKKAGDEAETTAGKVNKMANAIALAHKVMRDSKKDPVKPERDTTQFDQLKWQYFNGDPVIKALNKVTQESQKTGEEFDRMNNAMAEGAPKFVGAWKDVPATFSETFAKIGNSVENFAGNFITKFGKIVDFVQNSVSQLSNVFNMMHQNRMNDLTAQENAERAKWQAAYEDSDDYEDRMAELSKIQEERRKKVQDREARRQKAMATFQAAIGGAMAILSVLADPTLPAMAKAGMALFIGGLATAQIAAINGAQLPAFASGGVMPFSGAAIVGERGPEIVNLPAGSNITPNHMIGGARLYADYDREKVVVWTSEGYRHHSIRRAGFR